MNDQDLNRRWVSRVSFGLAAAALTGILYGGCQRSEGVQTHSEQAPAAAKMAPASPGSDAEKSRATEPSTADGTKPVAKTEEKPEQAKKPEADADDKDKDKDKQPGGKAAVVDGALSVKRLTVTSEIKDREPVADSEFTLGDDSILAFVEMKNDADVAQKIVITFERAGAHKVGFVELEIPAHQPRWRTWAQTRNIRAAGEWTAVVSTEDGKELARTGFQVSPAVGDG
jgi:hypothetical protein